MGAIEYVTKDKEEKQHGGVISKQVLRSTSDLLTRERQAEKQGSSYGGNDPRRYTAVRIEGAM